MDKSSDKLKKEDIADAIFDALTLYCIDNDLFQAINKLDKKALQPVQEAVEKLLEKFEIKAVE